MQKWIIVITCFIFLSACNNSTVTHPVKKSIIETVYASGKIISENEYLVYSLSSGTVKGKLVKEGDTIQKSQTLYVISSEAPVARLEAARSGFENAKQNSSGQSPILNDMILAMQSAQSKFNNDSLIYIRQKNLLSQNATSQMNVDNAFTNYTISLNQKKSAEKKYYATLNELNIALQNAKSQLAGAETDLNNYIIRSETSGTVFQTMKEVGETVRAGEVIALVGETSNRIIKLSVDQQDIDKIKAGLEVLLRTDITGSTIYHGTISRIYPVMNEADQTFRVDAVFKDSLKISYIHASVEANIIIQQKENALVVPRKAITAGDSIRIRKDGKEKVVFVHTGIHTLDDVEILNGLDESSQIIIPSQ